MNAEILRKIIRELENFDKEKDLITVNTIQHGFITGYLIEKIVYRTILTDGYDTDIHPTVISIRVTNSYDTKLFNEEVDISINQITKFDVVKN